MKNKCKILISLSVLLSSSFFVQCSKDEFKELIEEYSLDDNCIDNVEWNSLVEFISQHSNDRRFSKFIVDGSVDIKSLENYLNKINTNICVKEEKIKNVKIYLESSASMDGYLNGNTSYKNDIIDFVINIKNDSIKENWSLNYITNSVTPIEISGNVSELNKHLSLDGFRNAEGRATSDLNKIVKNVATDLKNGEVSVLISDMIYSIEGSNVVDLLQIQKSYIKDTFNELLKQNKEIEAEVICLNSEYNGTYYSYNNSKTTLDNAMRPYYLLAIGQKNNLNAVVENIKQDKNILYRFRFQNQLDESMYYSFVKSSNDVGSYKNERLINGSVKGISDISLRSREEGNFTFTVGVDFSDSNLSDAYIEDLSNYEIQSGKYEIYEIVKYSDDLLHQSSLNTLSKNDKKITHLIRFESKNNGYSNLKFGLKKNIPNWVKMNNTNDDTNIKNQLTKTFGFEYFFTGIFESYSNSTKNNYYKTFELTINN